MKRKSEKGLKGKLEYMSLTYLMEKKYRMRPDDVKLHGIYPSDCRLDDERKIALGIYYKSKSGPDYSSNSRLVDYLVEIDAAGWDCYIGISIRGQWQLINAVNLLTFLKRVSNVQWQPSRYGYVGAWLMIDDDMQVVESEYDVGVASPLRANSLSQRAIQQTRRRSR